MTRVRQIRPPSPRLPTLAAALAAALAAIVLALSTGAAMAQAAVVLVTEDEARREMAADLSLDGRGLTRGPSIEFVTPRDQAAGYAVPGPFEIRFVGRNGVPVNPQSVHVTYLRTPAIDVTSRLRAYIGPDGIAIPAALVPPGPHAFRIDVVDGVGRKASALLRFTAERTSPSK